MAYISPHDMESSRRWQDLHLRRPFTRTLCMEARASRTSSTTEISLSFLNFVNMPYQKTVAQAKVFQQLCKRVDVIGWQGAGSLTCRLEEVQFMICRTPHAVGGSDMAAPSKYGRKRGLRDISLLALLCLHLTLSFSCLSCSTWLPAHLLDDACMNRGATTASSAHKKSRQELDWARSSSSDGGCGQ